MALISKGTLSRLFVGAAIGGSALLVQLNADGIGQMIADQHKGAIAKTGDSLSSTFSPLRAGGSQDDQSTAKDPIAQDQDAALPQENDPRLSDPEFLEYIKNINEDFALLREDVLDNNESTDTQKIDGLLNFYHGLDNPKDIAFIESFGSHDKFLESVRQRSKTVIDRIYAEIKSAPKDNLANLKRANDIRYYMDFAGFNGLEEDTNNEIFDEDLAQKMTGIDPKQWDTYIGTLTLPAAQQALQSYRTGYAHIPVTEEQEKNNTRLLSELRNSSQHLRANIMRQNIDLHSEIRMNQLLGLTDDEIKKLNSLNKPVVRHAIPTTIVNTPGPD